MTTMTGAALRPSWSAISEYGSIFVIFYTSQSWCFGEADPVPVGGFWGRLGMSLLRKEALLCVLSSWAPWSYTLTGVPHSRSPFSSVLRRGLRCLGPSTFHIL